jgi:hypothetical protein
MNWRRGLLLAGINLAVAVPMILMMEARDQKYALTEKEIMAKAPKDDAPKPPEDLTSEPHQASPEQAGETVSFTFDPCTMWVEYPAQVVVMLEAEMPSVALSGWRNGCPPHWTLAGRLRGKMTWPPTPLSIERQRKIDAGLCLSIALQWFLMGGFPLARNRKWWADPGAFITACAVLAGATALIPVVDNFAKAPALIAMLGLLWWLGLLVWKTLKFGWRMTTDWRVPRSS